MNLLYDLDTKSFFSKISSDNSSIKNNIIIFDKGLVEFNNSIFDIDFSLLINDSEIPINIEGSIPINKSDELDLRLIGNEKFIELIDIFADEYFTFKEGDVNLRVILKGTLNKPQLNGFIVVKDSEIDFLNNFIKDILEETFIKIKKREISQLLAINSRVKPPFSDYGNNFSELCELIINNIVVIIGWIFMCKWLGLVFFLSFYSIL